MDFVKCEMRGVMENCNFITCKISKSRIKNSKFISGNEIIGSYLEGASLNQNNDLTKCYVVNNEEIVNCRVNESIIKFAIPGKNMKMDEQSTLVTKQLPLPMKTDAVQIEEIRDYSFIKKMRQSEDQGFGNAYNRNSYLKHEVNQNKLS